jgi:beta-glucosidase
MTGKGQWAEAFGKARELVGRMTLEEKVSSVFGAFLRLFVAG